MLKGIDVSNHQGSIDFAKVKATGIDVVIIKASEGKTYQDPYFRTYYDAAKANGLKVGAYHFLRGNTPEDEVNNFLSMVGSLDFDCKLVVDAEVDLGGIEATSRQVRAVVDILKSKGYEVVLYTGEYFYNSKLNNTVKDIPLWVAKYSTVKPNVTGYIGWQYTSSGSVSGINGNVDMNEFTEEILVKPTYDVPEDFDEATYLELNRDVAEAVSKGMYGLKSGAHHYSVQGKLERRIYKRKKYYVVTNYIPQGQYGIEIITLTAKYFTGLERIYLKTNQKGAWIETQYLPKEAAEALAAKLKADNLLWELVEE